MARVTRAAIGWRLLAGAALVLAVLAGVRWATFDAQLSGAAILGEIDPLSPGSVDGLRAIASARDDATVAEKLGALDVDAMERRLEEYARTLGRLRTRFHRGGGDCGRYPAGVEVSEEEAEAVADALVDAGLQDQLSEASSPSGRARNHRPSPISRTTQASAPRRSGTSMAAWLSGALRVVKRKQKARERRVDDEPADDASTDR